MADCHIWEEDPVNLRVLVKGKKYEGTKEYTFVFKNEDGGEEVGSAKATAAAGSSDGSTQATGKWDKAKKPADVTKSNDKLWYSATFELKAGSETLKNFPDKLFVHAKTITVTCKDKKDNSPFVGARCKLVQDAPRAAQGGLQEEEPEVGGGGQTVTDAMLPRVSDKDGKIVFNLKYPSSDFTLRFLRPYHAEWTPGKDKGVEREAIITYAPQVKFVFPIPAQEDHKQYVNLDPVDDHAPPSSDDFQSYEWQQYVRDMSRGRKIKIKVAPWQANEWKTGQKIYLKAKFHKDNLKRTSKVATSAAKDPDETLEMEQELGPNGYTTFEIDLGVAGGDKIVVEAGTVKGKADATVTIVTWRKLFYELLAPQSMVARLPNAKCTDGSDGFDLPTDIKKAVTDQLAKVFVDYSVAKAITIPDDDVPTCNKIDSKYLGKDPGDSLVVLTDVDWNDTAFTGKGFVGKDLKRTLYVKLCHECVNDTTVTGLHNETLTANTPLTFNVVQKWQGYIFEKNPHDGSNGVEVATWEADVTGLDPSQPHPGLTGGVARKGNLKVTYINHSNIKFELPNTDPDDPGKFVGTGAGKCPVKVVIKLKLPDGMFNGCAGGGRQLLTVRDKAPKSCAQTICHELGHSMGMTIVPAGNKVPKGMEMPKHVDNGGTYYRNRRTKTEALVNGVRASHQGPHCAQGIANKSAASFAGSSTATCTLYGEGGSKDPPQRTGYCDTCTKYIKARCLEDVRTGYSALSDDKC